jgi:hypothetical protein
MGEGEDEGENQDSTCHGMSLRYMKIGPRNAVQRGRWGEGERKIKKKKLKSEILTSQNSLLRMTGRVDEIATSHRTLLAMTE